MLGQFSLREIVSYLLSRSAASEASQSSFPAIAIIAFGWFLVDTDSNGLDQHTIFEVPLFRRTISLVSRYAVPLNALRCGWVKRYTFGRIAIQMRFKVLKEVWHW